MKTYWLLGCPGHKQQDYTVLNEQNEQTQISPLKKEEVPDKNIRRKEEVTDKNICRKDTSAVRKMEKLRTPTPEVPEPPVCHVYTPVSMEEANRSVQSSLASLVTLSSIQAQKSTPVQMVNNYLSPNLSPVTPSQKGKNNNLTPPVLPLKSKSTYLSSGSKPPFISRRPNISSETCKKETCRIHTSRKTSKRYYDYSLLQSESMTNKQGRPKGKSVTCHIL